MEFLVRLTCYRAHVLESMLEVLRDPVYPAAVDIALADRSLRQVAGSWIRHETAFDAVILQGAEELVGLSDRDAGVAGVGEK